MLKIRVYRTFFCLCPNFPYVFKVISRYSWAQKLVVAQGKFILGPGLSHGDNCSGLLPCTCQCFERWWKAVTDAKETHGASSDPTKIYCAFALEKKALNIEETSLQQQRVEEAGTTSYPEEHYSKTKQSARMRFVKTPTQESIEDSLFGTWCPNRLL